MGAMTTRSHDLMEPKPSPRAPIGLAWPLRVRYPAPMPEVTQRQIELEARRILREKLKRMPWHQGCSPEEQKRRIEADVEQWWHLEAEEAARRLLGQADAPLTARKRA